MEGERARLIVETRGETRGCRLREKVSKDGRGYISLVGRCIYTASKRGFRELFVVGGSKSLKEQKRATRGKGRGGDVKTPRHK